MTSVLTIFDFDDTLIKSSKDIQVRVTHADGKKTSLTSHEYAGYVKMPGDTFDYSDFNKYPHGAVPIDETFRALRLALEAGHDVIVLTARAAKEPVQMYLSDNGFGRINVVAVGNSDPRAKAQYVVDLIKQAPYDMVQVYEDNLSNIRAIKKIVTDSGILFRSVKVTASGNHVMLEHLLGARTIRKI